MLWCCPGGAAASGCAGQVASGCVQGKWRQDVGCAIMSPSKVALLLQAGLHAQQPPTLRAPQVRVKLQARAEERERCARCRRRQGLHAVAGGGGPAAHHCPAAQACAAQRHPAAGACAQLGCRVLVCCLSMSCCAGFEWWMAPACCC